MRYGGDFAFKAGILPFYKEALHAPLFLLAAPKPVKNAEDTVPFAIARGSRRVQRASGQWRDVRSREGMAKARAAGKVFEPAQETALIEGAEELGLPQTAIVTLYDCGILAYKTYGIHVFLAETQPEVRLDPARDSMCVRWLEQAQVQAMAQTGQFNPLYVPLLEAAARYLKS